MGYVGAAGRGYNARSLSNWMYWTDSLMGGPSSSSRYRMALSLVILVIDHFKAVNDRHGHQGGDAVLKLFAALAQAQTRDGDTLCRYGGEEFAVLLAHTPLDGAMELPRPLFPSPAKKPFGAGEGRPCVTRGA